MADFTWLPAELIKPKSQSDKDYLDTLYQCFVSDFVKTSPVFRGVALKLKKHPQRENKEATFWHLITEGKDEATRTLDYPRASKLPWVKPTIENEQKPEIKVWENVRNNEKRIVLWLEQKNYVVVLAERKSYLLPWTAYPVTYDHTRRKLGKEYAAYIKQKTPQ